MRLAQLKDGVEALPVVSPAQRLFLDPEPGLKITEHRLILEDAPCWQFMRLEEPVTVLAFQVVVESIYPGAQYDDVAIAEVLFPLLEEDLGSAPGSVPVAEAQSHGVLGPWVAMMAAIVLAAVITVWLRKREALDKTISR